LRRIFIVLLLMFCPISLMDFIRVIKKEEKFYVKKN